MIAAIQIFNNYWMRLTMVTCNGVATGQEMVLEKILRGHGKAMEVYLESGKIDSLNKSGKIEII